MSTDAVSAVPTGQVLISVDGAIATVTLSNPAKRNAISVSMWQALGEFARATHQRPEVRVVVVRGEGRLAFSAGADISGFAAARSGSSNARAYDDLVEDACVAIEGMRCPSIALMHGACFGAGASVAASCDLRLASTGSFIAVPAARLGLGYDPRGIARFRRIFGHVATAEILYGADRFPVERAATMGAVTEVALADDIEQRVSARARRIAGNAPLTVAAAKAALRAHALGDAGLLAEAMRLYQQADASADYAEGRAAFLQKREPQFKGR